MAKLHIIYDASQEIERIVKCVEEHIEMKKEEKDTYDLIQKIVQQAFDEGRKFEKSISGPGSHKDSLLHKASLE